MQLYDKVSIQIARLITKSYSTSFYSASCLFSKEIRDAIFSIYAFVRIADEIVDTFHDFDKQNLIKNFEDNYNNALIQKISTNPILHAFQSTLIKYNIPDEFVRSFLASMKKDLTITEYNKREEIEEYIYGSADVVGLMCLKIFCNNNHQLYNTLELYAKHLGSAFQKVNFLRDLKNDVENLNRKYFNDFDKSNFDDNAKNEIIQDIQKDFDEALKGIKQLPKSSRLAVYTAYLYYLSLLNKIKKTPAHKILNNRIRVNNSQKAIIILRAFIVEKLNYSLSLNATDK